MRRLLEKLSPAELWAWAYLCALAKEQGRDRVDIPVNALRYSRRHLTRLLKALQSKTLLVFLTYPKNQHGKLEVALARRSRLDINVEAACQACPGRSLEGPLSRVAPTLGVRQPGGAEAGPPGLPRACLDMLDDPERQLSLSLEVSKKLKALVELEQKDLIKALAGLSAGIAEKLEDQLRLWVPFPRSKKRSRAARLYAAIRYLQSGSCAQNPQAWVEGVAKKAEVQLWSETSSARSGRSQSQEGSDGASTYSRGRP